jgi:hypothetical protein
MQEQTINYSDPNEEVAGESLFVDLLDFEFWVEGEQFLMRSLVGLFMG